MKGEKRRLRARLVKVQVSRDVERTRRRNLHRAVDNFLGAHQSTSGSSWIQVHSDMLAELREASELAR